MRRVTSKLIMENDRELQILVKGVPVTIMNSVRRAAISLVPTLAIDKVYVFENTSVMNDQMLAHRIGLVPLHTPVGKYKTEEEHECEGECSECTVYLHLRAEAKDDYLIVKSADITSDDPDVYPVYGDIEIVKLAPGQKIELTMSARMGRGQEHAKWTPVTVAVVRGEPRIRIKHEKCDLCGDCIAACPKEILDVSDGKLIVTDKYKCTTCMLCVDACQKGAISVDIDENNSLLYLESVGSLRPKEILIMAFDEIIRKISVFKEVIGGG